MSKKLSLTLSYLIISIIILAFNHVALAATDMFFDTQVSIPGSDFIAGQEKRIEDNAGLICDYIVAIYKYAITIVGIFAMVAIAIGGAIWTLAAGNQTRITEGKSWITGGLLGLVLALGAFVVLSTISSDLVTCKLKSIQKIEPKNLPPPPPATVYGKQGLQWEQVAKKIGDGGNFYCCVIRSSLDGSGYLKDTKIIRCATLEAPDKNTAQTSPDGGCNYFYDNYNKSGTVKAWDVVATVYDYFFGDSKLFLEPRENRTNGEDNSATVYPGKCWQITDVPDVQKCMPADDTRFCKNHEYGTTCLTTTGDWGYCKDGVCLKCKRHCDPCESNFECPSQKNSPAANGEAGVICGRMIYDFFSTDSNDCNKDDVCDKEWGNGECP